jgi:hypothetical protein
MDMEKIVHDRKVPKEKEKMVISRDVSKDLTIGEHHRAISKSTEIDLRDDTVTKTLEPTVSEVIVPVMYGDKAIPPGPYTKEDIQLYIRYVLETATSADTQQIEKVMNVLDYLLGNTGFSTFV